MIFISKIVGDGMNLLFLLIFFFLLLHYKPLSIHKTQIRDYKRTHEHTNYNPGFYVFSYSVELQKANLEAQNSPSTGGTGQSSTASPLASAIPLAQLLAKPGALNALTSLSALGGLTELLGAQSGTPPVQTTGVHRTHKNYTPRLRSPGGSGGPTEGSKLKNERNKFNPY